MSEVVALVEDLKRRGAEQRPAESDYAKGLYEGSALAFELAARWLERALLADGRLPEDEKTLAGRIARRQRQKNKE